MKKPEKNTHSVGGVSKHLERLDRVGFQRAVENKETSKDQVALNLFSREMVDL